MIRKTNLILPGFWSIVFLGVTSFLGVLLSLGSNSSAVPLLLNSALVVSAFTVLCFVLISPLSRIRLPNPIIGVAILVLFLIGIGAARGYVFFEVNEFLRLTNPLTLETRILNSSVAFLTWGLVFTFIEAKLLSFRDQFRKQYAFRANEIARQSQLKSNEIAAAIDAIDDIQLLQRNLKLIAEQARGQEASGSKILLAAQQIRSEIETLLRPLSHRIWFDANKELPKFHWPELLKESLRNLRINAVSTTFVSTGTFFVGALSIFPPLEVLVRVGSYGLGMFFILWILSKSRGQLVGGWLQGVAILLTIGVATNFIGEIIVSQIFYEKFFTTEIVLATAGPITSFGILWVSAIFSQLRQDWETVSGALEKVGGKSANLVLSSRLAGYLHNSVQSQLTGIALALERTGNQDEGEREKLLQQLNEIAEMSFGQELTSSGLSPSERIEKVVVAWQGIISINCNFARSLDQNPKAPIVLELIEEAINNAVRHAKAKSISIDVTEVGEELSVVITHKGAAVGRAKAQLGLLWIERFSKEHSIVTTPSGNRRLTVVL